MQDGSVCCPWAACRAVLDAEGGCPMDPAVITAAPVAALPMLLLIAEGLRCLSRVYACGILYIHLIFHIDLEICA